jgi:type I restriction enzyme, S subunit
MTGETSESLLAPAAREFKPYAAYKHSGVEWLGEIPVHWGTRRLKTFASVQLSNVDKHSLEGQVPVKLCNYVDVYNNERINGAIDFMAATATPEQVRRFSLRTGDVLITKDSESWTDIAVPAVITEDLPEVFVGTISPLCGPEPAVLTDAFLHARSRLMKDSGVEWLGPDPGTLADTPAGNGYPKDYERLCGTHA